MYEFFSEYTIQNNYQHSIRYIKSIIGSLKFCLLVHADVVWKLTNYLIMCSRWKSTWNLEKWNETTSQTGIQLTLYILYNVDFGLKKYF